MYHLQRSMSFLKIFRHPKKTANTLKEVFMAKATAAIAKAGKRFKYLSNISLLSALPLPFLAIAALMLSAPFPHVKWQFKTQIKHT